MVDNFQKKSTIDPTNIGLTTRFNPNARTSSGETVLSTFADHDNFDEIVDLFKSANVWTSTLNETLNLVETPRAAKILIKNGADIESFDWEKAIDNLQIYTGEKPVERMCYSMDREFYMKDYGKAIDQRNIMRAVLKNGYDFKKKPVFFNPALDKFLREEAEIQRENAEIEKNGFSTKDGKPWNGYVKNLKVEGNHKTESYGVDNGDKHGEYTSSEREGTTGYDQHRITANYRFGMLHGEHIETSDESRSKIVTTYYDGKKQEAVFSKYDEVEKKVIYDEDEKPSAIFDKDGNLIKKYAKGKDITSTYKKIKKIAAKNVSTDKDVVNPKKSKISKAVLATTNVLNR